MQQWYRKFLGLTRQKALLAGIVAGLATATFIAAAKRFMEFTAADLGISLGEVVLGAIMTASALTIIGGRKS